MKHVALASLLVLCLANRSSLSALVLHRNGALVPADTPEVAAARDLHLQALAAVSAPEPEEEGQLASVDGGSTASEEEEFIQLTEEEARRLGFGLSLGGLGGFGASLGGGGLRFGGRLGGLRFGGGLGGGLGGGIGIGGLRRFGGRRVGWRG